MKKKKSEDQTFDRMQIIKEGLLNNHKGVYSIIVKIFEDEIRELGAQIFVDSLAAKLKIQPEKINVLSIRSAMNRKRNTDKGNLYPEYNTEDSIIQLAKRIKKLRIAKGFSSYETFAYENNLSRAQYGRYEKGADLRFTSLLRVLNALDITLEEFFKEGFEATATKTVRISNTK